MTNILNNFSPAISSFFEHGRNWNDLFSIQSDTNAELLHLVTQKYDINFIKSTVIGIASTYLHLVT